MSFFKRLKLSNYWKDVAWLASGTAIAHGISVVFMPILSRLYAPEDFAVLNIFSVSVGFTSVIATWRFERFVQIPKQDGNAWRLIQLAATFGICSILILTPIAYLGRHYFSSLLDNHSLAPWLFLTPFAGVALSMSEALQAWNQRMQQYKLSGESNIAGSITNVSLALMGSCFGFGVAALISGNILAQISKIFWLLKKHPSFRPLSSRKKLLDLLYSYCRFANAKVFSHFCMAGTAAIPSFFIIKTYGANELGQFVIAQQAISLPALLISNAIANAYYQRAASLWSSGKSFFDLWKTTAHKSFIIGIALYLPAIFIAPLLFPIIFGASWTKAGHYASFLAISAFFSFATTPMNRSTWIVGNWWYSPLWHIIRITFVTTVALLTWINNWDIYYFLTALVSQSTIIYLIDLVATFSFAKKTPQ